MGKKRFVIALLSIFLAITAYAGDKDLEKDITISDYLS